MDLFLPVARDGGGFHGGGKPPPYKPMFMGAL